MNKVYLNLRKVHMSGVNGLVLAICLLFAGITLSYVLFHNPHQDLHKQIFKTAENIRSYYRDKPAYWKLSTESAKDDGLIVEELLKNADNLKIGQGENGDVSMPNDNSFDIVLKNLNKSACINLSELSVSHKQQLGLQKITLINENGISEFAWGDDAHPLPIKRYTTRKLCTVENNTLIWTFQ
ncbi:MAG: hypothetical protein IKN71_06220 [Alphaproteobacteria bacterium]|nr:hypothetical protein [Alphaproteobacteria bacterium]